MHAYSLIIHALCLIPCAHEPIPNIKSAWICMLCWDACVCARSQTAKIAVHTDDALSWWHSVNYVCLMLSSDLSILFCSPMLRLWFSVWMIFSSLLFIFVNTNSSPMCERTSVRARALSLNEIAWCMWYERLWEVSEERKENRQVSRIYTLANSRTFAHSQIHTIDDANHLMNNIWSR